MVYKKLSIDELQRFPYPNLMAEIIESGYSICTVAAHMGLGEYRKEDDPEVWANLTNPGAITVNEALKLSRLFGAEYEYLFSKELKTISGQSVAYYRWYDWNKKKQEEIEVNQAIREISRMLKESPQLLTLVREMITWSDEKLEAVRDFERKLEA